MKFKKGVLDDHSDNFAIVFAAMGVSVGRIPLPFFQLFTELRNHVLAG